MTTLTDSRAPSAAQTPQLLDAAPATGTPPRDPFDQLEDAAGLSATRVRLIVFREQVRDVGRFLVRRPGFVVALLVVLTVIAAAIKPDWFTGRDPNATAPAELLRPPGPGHLFGTDQLGRDLFARVVHGSSLTIEAALLAVSIAVAAGLLVGVVSGFVGGRLDVVLMRFIDVLLAIPGLLLALAIVTALGFGIVPVAVAVGVGIAPGFARTTRAEVLRVKNLPYIEAVTVGGASRLRVVLRHVLPNSWGPVAALTVLEFGSSVISVASLSFLGFGVAPPAAEWGSLISAGRAYVVTAPWVCLIPGSVVAALVFSLNHIARSVSERVA
ncbi:ABC transporter permease [Brooklawnia cerclae]|uniref:Peptide/nickel transport system permease protein n=1 Tax=Brooklawnia cerclae TaxID=349934 RepID=A0ABX0SFN0_9ACTN|nr:ABC transporter permease [Brooklawnia cerclae]NIH57208.1 peptide/nickel transport system permease protein [Brooklawnia cerclae]